MTDKIVPINEKIWDDEFGHPSVRWSDVVEAVEGLKKGLSKRLIKEIEYQEIQRLLSIINAEIDARFGK